MPKSRRVHIVNAVAYWDHKSLAIGVKYAEVLQSTNVIDFEDTNVRSLAAELGRDSEPLLVAARCFEWSATTSDIAPIIMTFA